MKLIGLKVNGVRKLSAITMKFADKGLIQIRGKNKQGKSSLLDTIQLLIQGKKYLTKDMIQHGKEKAEIVGQLGGWEIKRVITKNSDRLEIKDIETGLIQAKTPQSFLDKFVNELTFDPLPFVQKSSNDKLLFMMDLCNVDFSKLDVDIGIAENERTFASRELKNHGVPAKKDKVDPVSISELTFELSERQTLIKAIETHEQFLTDKKIEINNIEARIKELKEELEISKSDHAQEVDILKELGEKPKIQPIIQKIDAAEGINEKAAQYKTYLSDVKECDRLDKAHEKADDKVKGLRADKKDKLSKANIPIKGLEIREDGLYYNGFHSENWSDQENYEISAKLCLAMQPELKAIFIDRGETYDNASLTKLHEWAEENDLQAIITIVDNEIRETVEETIYYLEEGKIVT